MSCVSESGVGEATKALELPVEKTQPANLRPDKIVFASTPYLGEGLLKDEYEPFVAYLSEKLGRPTEFRLVDSYEEMIRLIGTSEVHLGVLSPLSYVRAKNSQPGLHLLASQVANGAVTYSAYIIARSDSGIDDLKALKGKRFGFVDKLSTSGYLYPMAEFTSLGIVPETFFSGVEFAGDHEKLIEWVIAGKVDAGATSSSVYNIMRGKSSNGQGIAIIGKSGRIPYDAVVANARLDPLLVKAARQAILSLNTQNEQGRRVLRGPTHINGFVPAEDSLYSDVRRALKELED